MRHLLTAGAAAAALAAAPAAATPFDLERDFTSFFVFGDSLMDDGKFGTLFPPSVGGRFTNGPTFAEIIAQDFAVSANFALGGATAGPNETTYPLLALQALATLDGQIDAFIARGLPAAAGTNPLVMIGLGSNDIFQNFDEIGFDAEAIADLVIDATVELSAFTSFDDFILPLLPGATGTSPFVPFRQAFNARLLAEAVALEAGGLNIYTPVVDLASARIAADPLAFGITNLGSCTTTLLELTIAGNCSFTGLDGDGVPQFDPSLASAYAFVDDVHPSAPVHAEWALEVAGTVRSEIGPVPLPAAGWMLLAGLGGLAALRGRRA